MAVAMISSPSLESSHPLRLLAHSVAEAALKSDPASPSLPPSPAMLQGWDRFAALDALAPVPTPIPRRTLQADVAPFRAHTRTRSDEYELREPAAVARTRPSQLLRAQACRSANSSPTKPTFDVSVPIPRLPSLKQIQARVGHRRQSSVESLDGIQRPATPPSPARASRLPSFLRQRAGGAPKPRPISMPPLTASSSSAAAVHVNIIPPTLHSPTSPTESMDSMTSSSTASSADSQRTVPMITCTRAESESGSEDTDEDEVLVVPRQPLLQDGYFALETRREEKAREMKMRLGRGLRTRVAL